MSLVDLKSVQIKLGEYGTADARALSDPALHRCAQEYRRSLSSRMIPLDRETMGKQMPEGTYHVSRKVDGEFTLLAFDCEKNEAITVNPGGTVRVGLPLLKEACKLLGAAGTKKALIAGELYVVRDDGRPRVHDVCQMARNPDRDADLNRLRFAVFDLIEVDGKAPEPCFAPTWKRIQSIFGGGKLIHTVEAKEAKTVAEVAKIFADWVEKQSAEGLVARSDAAGMFKIKPRHSLDVVVVGFTEATADRAGLLHDLLIAVMRCDGTFHLLGRVGGGFSEEQRRDLLSDLKDMVVPSDYAEVNADHVAYQMVRPEWVIEVSCLDLVSETTRGGTIDRMVMRWDSGASRWTGVRRLPLASVISPQFVRVREDKTVHVKDAGIGQVAALVEVRHADRNAADLALPRSQILKREVYTKELSGKTMVRKFLLWKTNKEADAPEYPAYVLYYADFSAGRKTPLERELRVSSDLAQIETLWAQLKEENIKKGWNPVGAAPAKAPVEAKPQADSAAEPAPKKSRKAKAPAAQAAAESAEAASESVALPPETPAPAAKPKKPRAPKKKE